MTADVDAFEAERPRLVRLAYRMLGSVAEAEDVVQDAWLRWTRTDEDVRDPAGWLVRAVSRLCIDRLRSAKVQREAYRGPWLPEPLIEELSVDPLERAVFLLHDVFDEDYGAIAETLGRNEAAVRQLAVRARAHVRANRPRFTVSEAEAARLAAAFMAAAAQGDMAALSAVLAQDAVMVTDGGGKRVASLRPLIGRGDIMRLLEGLSWRSGGAALWLLRFRAVRINGYPGVIMEREDGPMTLAFQPGEDGRLAAIYMVRNPDKLTRLPAI